MTSEAFRIAKCRNEAAGPLAAVARLGGEFGPADRSLARPTLRIDSRPSKGRNFAARFGDQGLFVVVLGVPHG